MTGLISGIALLGAMGSFGVAVLRRARVLDSLERIAYGFPLGVVLVSLALLATASATGLGPGLVVALGAGSAVGAWAIWPKGNGRTAERPGGVPTIPLAATVVLAVIIVRWALLWGTALTVDARGLWAGYVNIWGDWSQHLGDVSSFAYGDNFPPGQPRFVGFPFAYHYLTSITAAAMVVLGMEPTAALPLQSFVLSVSVLFCIFAFARRMTGSSNTAALVAVLFLAGGGLGWWIGLGEMARADSISEALLHPWNAQLLEDANFRWPNIYFDLIAPQRGYLYGLPLGLLTLSLLAVAVRARSYRAFAAAGLVAGLLPFAHLGTFLALALIVPFLFLLFPSRGWVLFGALWVVLATPQILIQQGGAAGALGAIRFQPGWIAAPDTWGWFWLKNLGLFLPLLAFAFTERDSIPRSNLRFLVGFMPVFAIANLVVFQPWDWDNTKVLSYWFLAVCILVAAVLAKAWNATVNHALRALVVAAVVLLILPGVLLNLDQLTGRERHLLLSAEELEVAELVRRETPSRAVFAVGLQHNHPVPVLAGRRVLMSYPGWLWSQGMDYEERASDLRSILALDAGAPGLLAKYGIDFVVIGPNEIEKLGADLDAYRSTYPSVIRTASYEIFDVRDARSDEPGRFVNDHREAPR